MQKVFRNDIGWEQIFVVIPFYDFTVKQCYLNLPEDMVEDNPLDRENLRDTRPWWETHAVYS